MLGLLIKAVFNLRLISDLLDIIALLKNLLQRIRTREVVQEWERNV
jgi:hypothetical protein